MAAAIFFALMGLPARSAELVMFQQAGCSWCETFDREIGISYNRTEEGQRAPLRRLEIGERLPPELSFIQIERLTPLFVLVDGGREIGRIRGYGGREAFWMQLVKLMLKLDASGMGRERTQRIETHRARAAELSLF